jgi:hypothetical protein
MRTAFRCRAYPSPALACKAQRHGPTVIAADRWFPSSKTCSACGFLLAGLDLGTRHWTCPACGTRHDRDVNAAKNILAAGLAAAAGNGGDACGADVRHGQGTPVQTAVNRNPVSRGPESPSFTAGSSQSSDAPSSSASRSRSASRADSAVLAGRARRWPRMTATTTSSAHRSKTAATVNAVAMPWMRT